MTDKLKKRPLLITLDLEIAPDHNDSQHSEVLQKLLYDFELLGVKSTIFVTAEASERYRHLSDFVSRGHEIGCHGVHHRKDENYAKFTYKQSYDYLKTATERIQNATGVRTVYFRGPALSTSSPTQAALVDLGYCADFSVCSRRADVFISRGGNTGWYFAPSKPYHPHVNSPFRKGNVPLWVVPLSALGMPFMSGTLYLLRTWFMSSLYKALLLESNQVNNPIVFLFHSYEFTQQIEKQSNLIHRLYVKDRDHRYALFINFLKRMISDSKIECMTATQLIRALNKG